MSQSILTVSDFTLHVKKLLENQFPRVQIKGEVSNLKKQSSGHVYFSLKDQSAQLSAVMFRGDASKHPSLFKEGDEIVISGQLSVYPPRGNYQIIVRTFRHAGLGDLLVRLHQMKEELKKLGYFDSSNKKTLPSFPKKIAVVTSPTGAVIQDIIHVLKRRHQNFHLILYPAKVQGEGAAEEIATAIQEINTHNIADVMIVGRGGGSLEDLWPFNEKIVADAIYASKIPVISAVGHETDFSIADYVADVRAPTPSAAAEIVMMDMASRLSALENYQKQMAKLVLSKVQHSRLRLSALTGHPLFTSATTLLAPHMQKIDEITQLLNHKITDMLSSKKTTLEGFNRHLKSLKPQIRIAEYSARLKKIKGYLYLALMQKIQEKKKNLLAISSHLKGIDPKNLLKKGYCIPFSENKRSVILSAKELKEKQNILLHFHDGEALSEIKQVEHKIYS